MGSLELGGGGSTRRWFTLLRRDCFTGEAVHVLVGQSEEVKTTSGRRVLLRIFGCVKPCLCFVFFFFPISPSFLHLWCHRWTFLTGEAAEVNKWQCLTRTYRHTHTLSTTLSQVENTHISTPSFEETQWRNVTPQSLSPHVTQPTASPVITGELDCPTVPEGVFIDGWVWICWRQKQNHYYVFTHFSLCWK